MSECTVGIYLATGSADAPMECCVSIHANFNDDGTARIDPSAGRTGAIRAGPVARRITPIGGERPNLRNVTLADYAPIFVMLVLAGGFVAVSLLASRMFSPNRPTPEKLEPYECGIIPEIEATQRFPVKFYLVAMLFVVFDVEIIFLFAWASIWDQLGWYGVVAMLIFTFFVVETLMYVWKRGALDWNVHRRARYIPAEQVREAA